MESSQLTIQSPQLLFLLSSEKIELIYSIYFNKYIQIFSIKHSIFF